MVRADSRRRNDALWQRTYTYRTFSFLARHIYFASQAVCRYTKLAIGLLGIAAFIVAVFPIFGKKREMSIALVLALAASNSTLV